MIESACGVLEMEGPLGSQGCLHREKPTQKWLGIHQNWLGIHQADKGSRAFQTQVCGKCDMCLCNKTLWWQSYDTSGAWHCQRLWELQVDNPDFQTGMYTLNIHTDFSIHLVYFLNLYSLMTSKRWLFSYYFLVVLFKNTNTYFLYHLSDFLFYL